MKTSRLYIRTPEGIVFSQTLAGPVTRMLACLIDHLCVQVIVNALLIPTVLLLALTGGIAVGLYIITYFIISIGFRILLEWKWRGQTVGKRLFRLRVVDVEGMRLQFNQIVVRNLLRVVDAFPACYCVGGLCCWFNNKCQRLGDIAANTVVIHTPTILEPDLDQMLAGKYNSLRQYPHLAARLIQDISPVEADIVLQALLRRDEFDPAKRVELFEELAAHFRAKVSFPQEATDGVADEQFLRNILDLVFRPRPESTAKKPPVMAEAA